MPLSAIALAVGAAELAGVVQKAVALFGPDGPAPDRDERMNQLSGIDLELLSGLDTEYYDCPDDLRELLPLFVARNPEAFKAPE